MLIALAWKNIWRNKKRSAIIIAAITFGLWGGLFSSAIMVGMMESMVETAISRNLSHLQVHKINYDKDRDVRNYLPDGPRVLKKIRGLKGIEAAEGRTLVSGMAASPTSSYGTEITGVVPEDSKKISDIHSKIVEGTFFESARSNQIVIGIKLAERLNLKLNSKIVLSFQDLEGGIAYIACRIVGLFKTNSSQFDEMTVYVRQSDLFRILNTDPVIHEIAVRINKIDEMNIVKSRLQTAFTDLQVEDWKDLAPELAYLSQNAGIYMYLFVGIILFALLFGITNTMLMSVIDRIRELGVLIAIGMKKSRVFVMIVLEAVFLSLTGGLCGIGIGMLSISYFGNSGIDLTAISVSLESFGASAVLYPFLPVTTYIFLTIMIIVAANIAAFLPAWKATHLVPSEAIRTY
jgi:ABC-type lipoprotein release transport system permease subunit